MNPILKLFLNFLKGRMENASTKQTFDALIADLQSGGVKLNTTLAQKPDADKNRSTLAHIIGIERWGQHRLRSLLGEPLVIDEYDGYCPAKTTSWPELVKLFATTRAESVTLAQNLQQRGIGKSVTVPHNSFGDLSVGAWLSYLTAHASREALQIR